MSKITRCFPFNSKGDRVCLLCQSDQIQHEYEVIADSIQFELQVRATNKGVITCDYQKKMTENQ